MRSSTFGAATLAGIIRASGALLFAGCAASDATRSTASKLVDADSVEEAEPIALGEKLTIEMTRDRCTKQDPAHGQYFKVMTFAWSANQRDALYAARQIADEGVLTLKAGRV